MALERKIKSAKRKTTAQNVKDFDLNFALLLCAFRFAFYAVFLY